MVRYGKEGAGEYQLEIDEDGTTRAALTSHGKLTHFKNPVECYKFYAPLSSDGDHSAWNICYMVGDYTEEMCKLAMEELEEAKAHEQGA